LIWVWTTGKLATQINPNKHARDYCFGLDSGSEARSFERANLRSLRNLRVELLQSDFRY